MTVEELREVLSNYPDGMDVRLVEIDDDKCEVNQYPLDETTIEIIELGCDEEDESYVMDFLCITIKKQD